LLSADVAPTFCFGGNGCGFKDTLLAADAEPTFCFGGSGCGFNATLLSADVAPTFSFGGRGCGFNETLLATDTEPVFACFGGNGCGFNETLLAFDSGSPGGAGGNGWGFNETLSAGETTFTFCLAEPAGLFVGAALISGACPNADMLTSNVIATSAKSLFIFYPRGVNSGEFPAGEPILRKLAGSSGQMLMQFQDRGNEKDVSLFLI
jgi:hypothetical protein